MNIIGRIYNEEKMNPQTKRAVIGVIHNRPSYFNCGYGSCSMQLQQSDGRPAITDETDHSSAVSDEETVTLPKRQGE